MPSHEFPCPMTARRLAGRMVRLGLVAMAATGVLSGCRLVDQTTFGAKPLPPAPDKIALALDNPDRVPLITVRFNQDSWLYADALANAVDAADQRKSNVNFNVVTVVPAVGSDRQQDAAVASAQQDTLQIMDQMVEAGATADNIHLSARVDPTVKEREVRIYVH